MMHMILIDRACLLKRQNEHRVAYTAPNMIANRGNSESALIAVSNVHDRRLKEAGAQ
jgi:hypothetical protein